MSHSGDTSAPGGRKRRPSLEPITRLAARQFGVVSLAQLLSLALSYKQISGLVDQGFLNPLFRGVFAVGRGDVGPWGWLMAAFLAGGPDSFVSHRTAAGALELRGIYTKRIELTIPSQGGVRTRDGLFVHRTNTPPHPAEIATRRGIRVSSVPRILIEVAPDATRAELDHFITMAARKGILDITAVEQAFERHARRPGIRNCKEAFAAYRPRPDRKSDLEREFDEELQNHPDIARPQRNVLLGGFEVDNYWHEHKLVVELDGRPYHIAAREIEKDKFKDGKLLVLLCVRTLRITDTRWRFDRAGAMDDVRALLGLPPKSGELLLPAA